MEREIVLALSNHTKTVRIRFAFDRAEALGLQWGLDEFL